MPHFMPELPEVETVVCGLRPVLVGRRLARVVARRPDLRRPLPEDMVQRMTGAHVTAIDRRAKYGLIRTDRGDTLIFHLGMSGRMRIDPPAIEKHDHVIFETDEGHVVALNDARRFGSLDLLPTENVTASPLFSGMGPEPLSGDFSDRVLESALKDRRTPIKALLLDQRVVAGLGNIYVCEALFMAGIAPTRTGASLKRAEICRLVPVIKQVLERAIAAGGSTLRDHARPDGELGYFQHQFQVYGREAMPCVSCGRSVERIVQSGRSTFWCPSCQK